MVLSELDIKRESVTFLNNCEFECVLKNWKIKDEGRKVFVFPDFILEGKKTIRINVGEGKDNKTDLFWKNEEYVWTKTGDTLFLRDGDGKLVLWESY